MNALTKTDEITKAIDRADLADSTKAQYRKAIKNALEADVNIADAGQLADYALTLSKSSKSFLKAAVRLWSKGIEFEAKGQARPDNVDVVLATVYRVEALNEAIKVKGENGTKAHSWLSQAEIKRLLEYCKEKTLKCQRDKIILGLLCGAGLRRDELVRLTFADIKHQPIAGRIRTVLDITGKGDKNRVVPISNSLATALDEWVRPTGGQGRIARSVSQAGKLGETISAIGIFKIVNRAGATIGFPGLAPHDLRRSFAQIGYEAGVPIVQISEVLGHSSIATTQKYLNLKLNLETTVSDFVPFE